MRSWNDLGAGDEAVDPAIMLSRTRQVIVRPSTQGAAEKLTSHGFVPVPSGFHVFADRSTLTAHRSRRRQLRKQVARLADHELEVTVRAGFSLADRLDDLYSDLVAPWVYARGRSPHGVHWLPRFRRLAAVCVAVVATDRCDAFRAVSLFRVLDGGGFALTTAGGVPDRIAVGAVEAVHPALGDIRRAWRALCTDAVREAGVPAVSLGADDCIVDPGYVPVIADKLSWYPAAGWELEVRPRYVSLGTADQPDRFPLVMGVTSAGPAFWGRWNQSPARELRAKIISLLNTNG